MMQAGGVQLCYLPSWIPKSKYHIRKLQSRRIWEHLLSLETQGRLKLKSAQQANPNLKGSVDEVEMVDAGAEKARLRENDGASRGMIPQNERGTTAVLVHLWAKMF